MDVKEVSGQIAETLRINGVDLGPWGRMIIEGILMKTDGQKAPALVVPASTMEDRPKKKRRKKGQWHAIPAHEHGAPDDVKRCSVCKETKPRSEFFHAHNSRDLHSVECKACNAKRLTKYHRVKEGAK